MYFKSSLPLFYFTLNRKDMYTYLQTTIKLPVTLCCVITSGPLHGWSILLEVVTKQILVPGCQSSHPVIVSSCLKLNGVLVDELCGVYGAVVR